MCKINSFPSMIINHPWVGQGKENIHDYLLSVLSSCANIFQFDLIAKNMKLAEITNSENL